jgi:hypothetical protein
MSLSLVVVGLCCLNYESWFLVVWWELEYSYRCGWLLGENYIALPLSCWSWLLWFVTSCCGLWLRRIQYYRTSCCIVHFLAAVPGSDARCCVE